MQHRYHRNNVNSSMAATVIISFVGGLAVGLALMCLLDPRAGARRRSMVRNKAIKYVRQTGTVISRQAHHARNRVAGAAAEVRSAVRGDHPDDRQIHERVRSAIGRAVMHPGSIKVDVRDGAVTLYGPILVHEVDELIETVAGVRGVTEVVHRLDEHESALNVPGLQGGRIGAHGEP